jgi:hypothetical protein
LDVFYPVGDNFDDSVKRVKRYPETVGNCFIFGNSSVRTGTQRTVVYVRVRTSDSEDGRQDDEVAAETEVLGYYDETSL